MREDITQVIKKVLPVLGTTVGGGASVAGAVKGGIVIGAIAGAIGGPAGIAVGTITGAIIGLIVGYILKKKWESNDQISQLIAANQQLIAENQRLTGENQRKDGDISRLEAENVQKAHHIELLKASLDLLKWKIKKLEKENSALRRKLGEHDNNFKKLERALKEKGFSIDLSSPDSEEPELEEPELEELKALQKNLEELVQDKISFTEMLDPVVADDGRTYERSSLQSWYDQCIREGNPPTCPETRKPLTNPSQLKPDADFKKLFNCLRDNNLVSSGKEAKEKPNTPPPSSIQVKKSSGIPTFSSTSTVRVIPKKSSHPTLGRAPAPTDLSQDQRDGYNLGLTLEQVKDFRYRGRILHAVRQGILFEVVINKSNDQIDELIQNRNSTQNRSRGASL